MTTIIVTGASKGFGKSVVLAFARGIQSESCTFVIAGTDQTALNDTLNEIVEVEFLSNVRCKFHQVTHNLANLSALQEACTELFDKWMDPDDQCKELYFINNAASLGPLAPIGNDNFTLQNFQTTFDFNITSSCFLTSELIRRLRNPSYLRHLHRATIVNVSSLAAIQPFESWSMYCAGKAARDMFHRTLAEEQKKIVHLSRHIKVLNYAPGPMDTNMQKQIREGPDVDAATREVFIKMKNDNQLVDVDESATKLFRIVIENVFETGSHIDFFDK